jgi:DNA-binding response OmpR family regulator
MPMRRILIVDDDQRILQLLSEHFKHAYTVEIATDAGEALAIVRRQRPDLVLLDIMLPGISGLHLLREMRRADPTLAVVIVTGTDTAGTAEQALETGAARFVRKPFSLDDIDRIVAELIANPPTRG